MWGSVFAFSDHRKVNILKSKEGLGGPKLPIFSPPAVLAAATKDITFADKLCLPERHLHL